QRLPWLACGRFTPPVWWLAGVTAVGSAAALLGWFLALRPDLTHFLGNIPRVSPALLVVAGLGFSLLNAAVEEAVFRGVVMEGLSGLLAPGWLVVPVQAAAFGSIHFIGVPNGWLGVIMATLYGVMLGLIRRCSQGMLAPFATHVVADVVIYAILACWV
ncbi:MAG: CPBP family intramembrane glutamic endopeptidase, partial [Candidatus Latescibacterota bacterium]